LHAKIVLKGRMFLAIRRKTYSSRSTSFRFGHLYLQVISKNNKRENETTRKN
jgi:hypothetical protein